MPEMSLKCEKVEKYNLKSSPPHEISNHIRVLFLLRHFEDRLEMSIVPQGKLLLNIEGSVSKNSVEDDNVLTNVQGRLWLVQLGFQHQPTNEPFADYRFPLRTGRWIG